MRFLLSAKEFTRWDKILYQIIRVYEERSRVHWLESSWNDYQDVDPEGKWAIGKPRRKWSLIRTSLNSQIPARKWSRFISSYCRKSLQCGSGRCFGNAIWGPHVHYCEDVSPAMWHRVVWYIHTILEMKAARAYYTLVPTYQTTRCNVPEGGILLSCDHVFLLLFPLVSFFFNIFLVSSFLWLKFRYRESFGILMCCAEHSIAFSTSPFSDFLHGGWIC